LQTKRKRSAGMPAVTVRIELVLVNLAAQSITMNTKDFGGARLVAIGAVQNALDEALLEFADGFIKQDSAFYHLIDEPFQLIFHSGTLR
jgi:hypothetical protein